jgi:hypothetical protein
MLSDGLQSDWPLGFLATLFVRLHLAEFPSAFIDGQLSQPSYTASWRAPELKEKHPRNFAVDKCYDLAA